MLLNTAHAPAKLNTLQNNLLPCQSYKILWDTGRSALSYHQGGIVLLLYCNVTPYLSLCKVYSLNVITLMILLICLSRDQHQYKKATELLQKSLDIRAEFLGESHPVVSQ